MIPDSRQRFPVREFNALAVPSAARLMACPNSGGSLSRPGGGKGSSFSRAWVRGPPPKN
jgi:hypothetical protein